MHKALESVDVVKFEESETSGGEEDAVLSKRATDKIVGLRTGDWCGEWVGGEPTRPQ